MAGDLRSRGRQETSLRIENSTHNRVIRVTLRKFKKAHNYPVLCSGVFSRALHSATFLPQVDVDLFDLILGAPVGE